MKKFATVYDFDTGEFVVFDDALSKSRFKVLPYSTSDEKRLFHVYDFGMTVVGEIEMRHDGERLYVFASENNRLKSFVQEYQSRLSQEQRPLA